MSNANLLVTPLSGPYMPTQGNVRLERNVAFYS